MFGISDDDKDKQIASLKEELDGLSDSLACEQQGRAEAESRMAAMVQARDPAQMDALAGSVALVVADTFARGFDGGHFADGWIGPVQMRHNCLVGIIREHIDMALMGAKREDI